MSKFDFNSVQRQAKPLIDLVLNYKVKDKYCNFTLQQFDDAQPDFLKDCIPRVKFTQLCNSDSNAFMLLNDVKQFFKCQTMGKDAVFYPVLVKLGLAKVDKDRLIIFDKNVKFGANAYKLEAYGVYLVNYFLETDPFIKEHLHVIPRVLQNSVSEFVNGKIVLNNLYDYVIFQFIHIEMNEKAHMQNIEKDNFKSRIIRLRKKVLIYLQFPSILPYITSQSSDKSYINAFGKKLVSLVYGLLLKDQQIREHFKTMQFKNLLLKRIQELTILDDDCNTSDLEFRINLAKHYKRIRDNFTSNVTIKELFVMKDLGNKSQPIIPIDKIYDIFELSHQAKDSFEQFLRKSVVLHDGKIAWVNLVDIINKCEYMSALTKEVLVHYCICIEHIYDNILECVRYFNNVQIHGDADQVSSDSLDDDLIIYKLSIEGAFIQALNEANGKISMLENELFDLKKKYKMLDNSYKNTQSYQICSMQTACNVNAQDLSCSNNKSDDESDKQLNLAIKKLSYLKATDCSSDELSSDSDF